MPSFLRAFGPATAGTSPVEAVRAGFGAFLALALCGLFVLAPSVDLRSGLFLIAPFGASSVLLFAVPNSPLAQPWSAIVGNTLAALVGVAACQMIDDPALRIAVAVGGAISVMILCRAVHPPAGAVAMTAAMNPQTVSELGFRFALTPVAAGTILLVLIAILYARATGRHYPFRQFEDPNHYGTRDREPFERLGLSREELTAILDRYRQSFNLGVEDLARLIGAAERQAATHRTQAIVAADVMSRDLVTVAPATHLDAIADIFQRRKFTSLPVVTQGGEFRGLIFQIHLIAKLAEHSLLGFDPSGRPLKRVIPGKRNEPLTAEHLMDSSGPRVAPSTPIATFFHLMAERDIDAVPVLDGERLAGIVTRTDLIAALAHRSMR